MRSIPPFLFGEVRSMYGKSSIEPIGRTRLSAEGR